MSFLSPYRKDEYDYLRHRKELVDLFNDGWNLIPPITLRLRSQVRSMCSNAECDSAMNKAAFIIHGRKLLSSCNIQYYALI
jgi:hypothetical protein